MDERVVQFKVGVMVLATILITIILIVMFGGQGPGRVFQGMLPGRGAYQVKIRFKEAPGVNTDTPIRKSGIVVGRVVDIQFADERQRDVIVTAAIDYDKRVFSDEVCQLARNVMGDSRLEIVAGPRENAPPRQLAAGDELGGAVIADPMQAVGRMEGDIHNTFQSVGDASASLNRFVAKLDAFMGPAADMPDQRMQLRTVLQKMSETLDSIKRAADNANDLLGAAPGGKSEAQLTLERIRAAADNMNVTLGSLGGVIRSMDETVVSARTNLRNLEPFTANLGQQGDELVAGLTRVTTNFDGLLTEVRALTAQLNNPQGTVGKLLHDPSLYDNLNRTAQNVDELTRRMRPIVEDVRVFTDHISRHPEDLGVRGAISPNNGTKW